MFKYYILAKDSEDETNISEVEVIVFATEELDAVCLAETLTKGRNCFRVVKIEQVR